MDVAQIRALKPRLDDYLAGFADCFGSRFAELPDLLHDGVLEFAEVTVDENSGTVTLRARFPNPDGLLLPGMFVRLVTPQR